MVLGQMYNKSFNLTPRDIELIETALRNKLLRRAQSRMAHTESTIQDPNTLDSVKEIDAEIKEINELNKYYLPIMKKYLPEYLFI